MLLLGLLPAASAQTEEPMSARISEPAGIDFTLDGTLTLPNGTKGPVPVVLLIAGSGPTDRDGNSPVPLGTLGTVKGAPFRMLADSLARLGIAVARYDKRYAGAKQLAGSARLPIRDFRFDYYVSDALGFIRQLQADRRFSRVIVAGHSEGSLVGMLAAKRAGVPAYISLSGAGRSIAEVLKTQYGGLPEAQRQRVWADLDSLRAGLPVRQPEPVAMAVLQPSTQPLMMSWMRYDPAAELRGFRGKVLLVNGERDMQVGVDEAKALKAARPDALLLLFPGMTHMLKNVDGTDQLANLQTYVRPDLPLTPGLATAMARFINAR
ncbi:alpha/beta hydrolase [Spirosoma luteolum]